MVKGSRSKQSRSGISLVAVLVSMAILAFGAVVFSKATGYFRINAENTDRLVNVDQLLVDAAASLQGESFSSLISLCREKSALGQFATGNCVSGGALNRNLPSGDQVLETLIDWEGDSNTSGQVCIELYNCNLSTGSLLLEIQLKAVWTQANAALGLSQKVASFRRSRW